MSDKVEKRPKEFKWYFVATNTTAAKQLIKGGVKSNVVPGTCSFVINRRFIPEERLEDVVAEVERAVDKGKQRSRALSVTLEHQLDYPPVVFDMNSPHMERLKRTRRNVCGYEDFLVGGISGSSDMGFVAEALSTTQFIGMSPARADNLSAHSADEHVGIPDLVMMTKELVHYLVF